MISHYTENDSFRKIIESCIFRSSSPRNSKDIGEFLILSGSSYTYDERIDAENASKAENIHRLVSSLIDRSSYISFTIDKKINNTTHFSYNNASNWQNFSRKDGKCISFHQDSLFKQIEKQANANDLKYLFCEMEYKPFEGLIGSSINNFYWNCINDTSLAAIDTTKENWSINLNGNQLDDIYNAAKKLMYEKSDLFTCECEKRLWIFPKVPFTTYERMNFDIDISEVMAAVFECNSLYGFTRHLYTGELRNFHEEE